MAYISKIESGGVVYDIAPPDDLTADEQAEFRSRIGVSGEVIYQSVSVSVSQWATTRVVSISNAAITAASLVILSAMSSSAEAFVKNNIRISGQSTGRVTLTCSSTPSTTVTGVLTIINN